MATTVFTGWLLIIGYGSGGSPIVVPSTYQSEEVCLEARAKVLANATDSKAFAATCVPGGSM